ncbi:MAG: hypothetical protein HZA54_07595 [Planctomycetes bacterium]|nr:hypothetical protein [Planctomycetota bacterium]
MTTTCPGCHREIELTALPGKCPSCAGELPAAPRPPVSRLAVVSLLLGVLSILSLSFAAAGVAVLWFMRR